MRNKDDALIRTVISIIDGLIYEAENVDKHYLVAPVDEKERNAYKAGLLESKKRILDEVEKLL